MYDLVYEIFRKTPDSVRKIGKYIPIKYRLGGGDFIKEWEIIQESEEWTRKELEQLQRERLDELLHHAVENVPYYSNIELSDENPFENLKKFPIIDKNTIRENKSKFVAKNISSTNTHTVTTGGTTGDPLEFRLDNSIYGKEWAYIMSGWSRVGYSPGDKMVSFRGVEFPEAKHGKYWQYNPFYNSVEMSPFHMNEETLPKYVEKITNEKPKFIHGYPSAITNLARYVDRSCESFPDISAVLAASENVYKHQRELIESAFDTRLFSHYGLSEKSILAAECEQSTDYHIFPQYCVVETIDENMQVLDGDDGELVGTSLLNFSMPFIRYRTGDHGGIKSASCDCGRDYYVLSNFQGRGEREGRIYKEDGGSFTLTSFYYTMHGDALVNVNRLQFVQEERGELKIRVVGNGNFDYDDIDKISNDIEKKIGDELNFHVESVEDIELTDSGKQKLLIQNIE